MDWDKIAKEWLGLSAAHLLRSNRKQMTWWRAFSDFLLSTECSLEQLHDFLEKWETEGEDDIPF